ncbi:MAG: hypothetical protein R8G34_18290 [Paracoccaceae bacterium]|nr:hypothetical protein [Paracoccaceae bacterium]
MTWIFVTITTLLILTGCTTLSSRTQGTIAVDGKTYPTIVRAFRTGNDANAETFATTTISLGALRVSCTPGEQQKCAKIVRRAERGEARSAAEGSGDANIYTLPFGL